MTPNAGPAEISDPSPVASSSNGTEGTEIDDSSNNTVESDVILAPAGPSEPPANTSQTELSVCTILQTKEVGKATTD